MQLINEHGEIILLETAFAASVSNPKLRRLELMTRMAGCERYAQDAGDEVPLSCCPDNLVALVR